MISAIKQSSSVYIRDESKYIQSAGFKVVFNELNV